MQRKRPTAARSLLSTEARLPGSNLVKKTSPRFEKHQKKLRRNEAPVVTNAKSYNIRRTYDRL